MDSAEVSSEDCTALVVFSYASPFADTLRLPERVVSLTVPQTNSVRIDELLAKAKPEAASLLSTYGGRTREEGVLDCTVRVKQGWRPGGRGGTSIGFGASVYDASLVLLFFLQKETLAAHAKLCATESETTFSDNVLDGGSVLGKTVLELGCGTGLLSLGAALLGLQIIITHFQLDGCQYS